MTPQEIAARAAEAVRALNHATRPGVAQSDDELDVVGIYDVLGELALMTDRLPQLLHQLENLLDALVEADQVLIVDGPNVGDPAAVAAIAGHVRHLQLAGIDRVCRRGVARDTLDAGDQARRCRQPDARHLPRPANFIANPLVFFADGPLLGAIRDPIGERLGGEDASNHDQEFKGKQSRRMPAAAFAPPVANRPEHSRCPPRAA